MNPIDIDIDIDNSKQAVIKREIPVPAGFKGVSLNGHTVLYVGGTSELPEAFDTDSDFIREVIPGESGESYTNTGAAMVSCDIAGKPLRGFKVQKSGAGKFSTGSIFVTGTYITVNFARQGDEIHVDLTKSLVKFPVNDVETIWEYNGHIDDISLPDTVSKYRDAIWAAVYKGQCYHCKCLHFYGDHQICRSPETGDLYKMSIDIGDVTNAVRYKR